MRSAFVSPSFLVSDSRGGGGDRDDPPPLELVPILKTYAKYAWPGPITPPPPWNVDDITRAMSKGVGCLWMSKSGGVFQFVGGRMTSRGQCPRGGACECLHPPPFRKSCIRAWIGTPPPPKKKLYPISPTGVGDKLAVRSSQPVCAPRGSEGMPPTATATGPNFWNFRSIFLQFGACFIQKLSNRDR